MKHAPLKVLSASLQSQRRTSALLTSTLIVAQLPGLQYLLKSIQTDMSQTNSPKVILLTGPAGTGKTSLSERIAQHADWVCVSEDRFWEAIKYGHPAGEMRTAAEQKSVQASVLENVIALVASGKNVVLEFIVYEDPPRPLIVYINGLADQGIRTIVRVLKPTVAAILERQKARGREDDTNIELATANARHQTRRLESAYIQLDWVVDNSRTTLEDAYAKWFSPIVEDKQVSRPP